MTKKDKWQPPLHQVHREGGHQSAEQAWKLKAVRGQEAWLQLAGMRQNMQPNRFAFKHLLDKPRASGRTADEKLQRRLMHRIDRGGTKDWNPYPGAQSAQKVKEGSLQRKDKFGDADTVSNTVIDLSLIELDVALVCMAEALIVANIGIRSEAHVDIVFPKACVRTATAQGVGGSVPVQFKITASSKITVSAERIGVSSWEVFHCVPPT